jgi:hypothetical protein
VVRAVVVIHNAVPYLHAYLVRFEYMKAAVFCTRLAQTSLLPIGPKDAGTLLPGTRVLVALAEGSTAGLIVGVEPTPAFDPAAVPADWIHMAGRCGIHVDTGFEAPLRARDKGDQCNWATGRFRDNTTAGEWGAVTETGMRVYLDSFMAQVALDEATGLFVFYQDGLVRLAGPNLDVFSAAHHDQHKDDEGETLVYRGWTPYPWEHLGAYRPGVDASRQIPDDQSQASKPYYASLEPARDDQQPFHRRVFLGGYVGQAGKDLVALPPRSGTICRTGVEVTPDNLPVGVLEEQRLMTGTYMLRSAGGVHICKSPSVPMPYRIRQPEDLDGDNPDNYKASGRFGSGDPHKVAATIEQTEDDQPAMQRIAALADELAYRRNWEAEHALAYHGRDFALPEEQDGPLLKDYAPTPVAKLIDDQLLPEPTTVPLTVDHRYGDKPYAPVEGGFHIFEQDGAVVVRGGGGCSLVMAAGNVTISCPGDFTVRAGRRVVQWAGRDWIARARNDAELTTSLGDVRVKSEKGVHVLAGNSGKGGVLIESRGEDNFDVAGKQGSDLVVGGILLKAGAGTLAGWGKDVYLRSTDSGDIRLDADRGLGTIYEFADSHRRYLETGAYDYLGPASNVTATNSFELSGARVGGGLDVVGPLTAGQGASVVGTVQVAGGGVASELDGSLDAASAAQVKRQAAATSSAVAATTASTAVFTRSAHQLDPASVTFWQIATC